jgi:CheY-like chemotaxis protein
MADPKGEMAEPEGEPRSNKRAITRDPRERNVDDALQDYFSKYKVLKVALTVVLVIFAFTRFYYYKALSTRMDVVFLSLALSVFLVWMIPWEQLWQRLRGFGVGGVGITLQKPDVKAAIVNISFKPLGTDSEKQLRDRLQRRLESLEVELQTVRGSKVLWIDDHPHTILGERRLLRALGVSITPAESSQEARDILKKDNDFDLIITDVWRIGGYEGVNYVVSLRNDDDARISSLPVIFYAAYHWEDLVDHTRPARLLRPEAEISNTIDDLIVKTIRRLSEERRNPITVSAQKIPTTDSTPDYSL